jgi:4-hydroxy-tetrahydrodipicolinate synthase
MAVGAKGVISVASNIIPREVAAMVKAFTDGKPALALKLHAKNFPLFRDLFLETNPIPVKTALAMVGQIEEEFRLPLVGMGLKNREMLKATLKRCGVLKT